MYFGWFGIDWPNLGTVGIDFGWVNSVLAIIIALVGLIGGALIFRVTKLGGLVVWVITLAVAAALYLGWWVIV